MILDWPDCSNVRDLGGLTTVDQREVRPGALLRSDKHDLLTPVAIQAVRNSAVSRIVDLRWGWECERHPSPFARDSSYRHVPMLNDVRDYEPPPDTYGPMLDHNQRRIGAAFRAVAEAPPGCVVVHCHAGKDRTGVLVALLLTMAGVGPQEVADDYALTDGCSPSVMLNTLAHIERQHDGVASYLIGAGVELELLGAVRARLLV